MLKLDTLRAAITAAIPELARNPENLRIWIERGTAESRGTASEAFAFRFEANVLIVEMGTDIAVLGLALFRWARVNQPDLLVSGNDGFSFDVDILDNRTADVLVKIQIQQSVAVTPRADGASDLAYLPEPDPLFLDDLGLGGVTPVPNLAGLDIDDMPY
jgi:P2 phage tail completion protein R (GpR)